MIFASTNRKYSCTSSKRRIIRAYLLYVFMHSEVSKTLLWDIDSSKTSLDQDLVILRVLEFGDRRDVDILFSGVQRSGIEKVFEKHFSGFDRKTQNYWNLVFHKNIPLTSHSSYDQIDAPVFTRNFG